MKYTPEKIKEIADHLSNGVNRTDTCTLSDISYETFTVWMKKPEFSDAIKKAEAQCKSRNIGIIQQAANKTWQAAAWWLERKHPNEFGLKPREIDNPVQSRINAEEALRIMRELDSGTLK